MKTVTRRFLPTPHKVLSQKSCNTGPIVLFCDFGLPYTGQMKAKIIGDAPNTVILDLFHDVPAYGVEGASALLAAHVSDFPKGSIFICVVDPGVGSSQRKPGAVFADGRWFVGPLNGLFEHVLRQASGPAQANETAQAYEIMDIPQDVSATFQGRDIFAPMAAQLALGDNGSLSTLDINAIRHPDFSDDVKAIIYIDGFGNMMTGIRAVALEGDETLEISGQKLTRHRTFSDVPEGDIFVYENSVGLLEIAANQENASEILNISIQSPIKITQV